jgi:subtilisin family serine protease
MKMTRLINLGVALMMLAAFAPVSAGTALAQEGNPQGAITRDTPYIPGEILVSFPEGKSPAQYKAQVAALAGQVQAAVVRSYKNLALLDIGSEADVEAAAVLINNSGLVNYAQPNYLYWVPERDEAVLGEPLVTSSYQVSTDSNGSTLPWNQLKGLISYYKSGSKWKTIASFPIELLSGKQWGWDAIEADLIWTETKASPYVCVLDTGIDTAHPDLSGKVVNGYDFVNDDKVPNDDNGHGTHIAGIIAAKTNSDPKGDADSVAGVSNFKVYNVKVMNSQGYGSSYSIAAGLTYCGNLGTVRVINMSLVSKTPDPMIWNALVKALDGKSRVVVAAAGNESTSDYRFPAAWSYTDSWTVGGSYNTPNNPIQNQIIAVGAGRSPSSDIKDRVWVDTDGDGFGDADEKFLPEQCASGLALDSDAYGSNYGPWVSIVAPGEAIYSTTPISYPFYLNYFEPHVAPRYDYMSGTSQAAAFVSGAAARLWSIKLTELPSNIKKYLVERGNPLKLASSSNPLITDSSNGFDNGAPPPYTLYGVEQDDIIPAPFCWPEEHGSFGGAEDMSNATYLNLAAAMQRTAMLVEVKDATTGLPFENKVPAYVEIKDISATATGVRRGYARTVEGNKYVALLNLPTEFVVNNSEDENFGKMKYAMNVSRSGNTVGLQTFNTVIADPELLKGKMVSPYTKFDVEEDPDDPYGNPQTTMYYNRVSLAPNTDIQFVLDWFHWYPEGGVPDTTNLDMFLWVPKGQTGYEYALIGSGSEHAVTMVNNVVGKGLWPADATYEGMGTLLDPVKFGGNYSPYATYLFDGGELLNDKMGKLINPSELITAKAGTVIKTAPFSKIKYDGTYYLTVTDYNDTILTNDRSLDYFSAPIVRVWVKGKLVQTVKLQDAGTCIGTETWWRVLTYANNGLNAEIVPINSCKGLYDSKFIDPRVNN